MFNNARFNVVMHGLKERTVYSSIDQVFLAAFVSTEWRAAGARCIYDED